MRLYSEIELEEKLSFMGLPPEIKKRVRNLIQWVIQPYSDQIDRMYKMMESKVEIKEIIDSDAEVSLHYVSYSDFCKMQLKYEEQLSCYKEKINDVYNVCDIVLDGATNWDEEQLDEFFEQVGRIVGYGRKEKTDVT